MRNRTAIALLGGVSVAVLVASWSAVGWILRALGGECSPETDRLNAACYALEKDVSLGIRCFSRTGTREWAACEDRTAFTISWAAPVASSTRTQEAPGGVSGNAGVSDGGDGLVPRTA